MGEVRWVCLTPLRPPSPSLVVLSLVYPTRESTKEKCTAHARMGVVARPTHGFMRGLRAFERWYAMLVLKQNIYNIQGRVRRHGG